MSTYRFAAMVVVSLAIAVSSAVAYWRTPAALGTVEIKGGSVSVEFAASALAAGTPAITGVIKNANTEDYSFGDLTVTVTGKNYPTVPPPGTNPPHDPPAMPNNASKLSRGGGAVEQSGTTTNVNEGTQTHNAILPGGGTLGPMASMDIGIDLTSVGNAGTVVVTLTPSAAGTKPKGTAYHSNMLDGFRFDSATAGTTHTNPLVVYDRLSYCVTNVDVRDPLVQLIGTVAFPTGSNLELSQIVVQDPDDDFDVIPGATVSISGNSFTISNLSLGTARRCEVIAIFNAAATGASVSVSMSAAY